MPDEWYCQGKKHNSFTMIDEVQDIFFWNPFFSHCVVELFFAFRSNLISYAYKVTMQKAELSTPGNPHKFLNLQKRNGTCNQMSTCII